MKRRRVEDGEGRRVMVTALNGGSSLELGRLPYWQLLGRSGQT